MSRKVVIASACRTPIGNFGGSLADINVSILGKIVIQEALKRAGIKGELVDEVFMGCVLQSGMGQNVARQAAVGAGIPVEIPAVTINMVCGSGLRSVGLAVQTILSGYNEIVVAGGMENMSQAPYLLKDLRWGAKMGDIKSVDSILNDALMDAFHHYHMGITAENIADKYSVTREEQDIFAFSSQQKAAIAQASNVFTNEIVAVDVPVKKGEVKKIEMDEYIRKGTTIEKLSALKSTFKTDGTVTAGNASGINDGAAALVVMSEKRAKILGIKPLAVIVSYSSAGVEPEVMGMGPVYSTRHALDKAGLCMGDIDLIEANEAFAVQCIAVARELKMKADIVNVNGGAIALGHPVGASGSRILVSLLYEMNRRKSRYGLATLCVGGGMGISLIVERYEN